MTDRDSMVVLFGGSFDPVHRGHLLAAEEARRQLGVDRIWLLPCHIPPHKARLKASPEQRLEMLQRALADYPNLAIDTWELEQRQPSYTLQTLQRYRQQVGPDTPLVFLMGWDSLQNLPSWYQWQKLEIFTHFAVWQRPGYSELPSEVAQWLASRQVRKDQLAETACGAVALLETTPVNISSTELRCSGDGHTLLPEAVQTYINEHDLYSPSGQ